MNYKVITAVATEPVTLAEARLQCKVDSDDTTHDALLLALITAARETAEHGAGRALAAQTLEAALDEFPDDAIVLPLGPVASITSITYVDTNGDTQTLATDQYALSTYGDARTVSLTYGNSWPSTRDLPDAVKVKYVTGSSCPKAAKAAILLEVETQFPLNSFTPAERADRDRARDALLNTCRVYGF